MLLLRLLLLLLTHVVIIVERGKKNVKKAMNSGWNIKSSTLLQLCLLCESVSECFSLNGRRLCIRSHYIFSPLQKVTGVHGSSYMEIFRELLLLLCVQDTVNDNYYYVEFKLMQDLHSLHFPNAEEEGEERALNSSVAMNWATSSSSAS